MTYERQRGYFAVGVYGMKNPANLGTLWRSAHNFDAAYMFTVGKRFKRQTSDTTKAWKHTPMFEFRGLADFLANRPADCALIGIEQSESSKSLAGFQHPERAIYVLGAEDTGLPLELQTACQQIVHIDTPMCINVAVAGSIVMYDRSAKRMLKGEK